MTIRAAADPALADRGWRGYDPRAAAPRAALALAASAALLAGRWYHVGLTELAAGAGAWLVYAAALLVWPAFLVVPAYRAVTYTYRLTDRALLLDRGPLTRAEPPVWLADVTGVVSGAGWLGRRLGVGWVRVAAGDRVVRLRGVRDPGGYAIALRAAAATARAAGPGEP